MGFLYCFAGSDGTNAPSLSLMLGRKGKAGGGDDIEASKSLSGNEGRPTTNVTNPLH